MPDTAVAVLIPGHALEPAGRLVVVTVQLAAVLFTVKSVPVWVGNVTSTDASVEAVAAVDVVAQIVPPVVVTAFIRSRRKKAFVNCGGAANATPPSAGVTN